MTKTDYKIMDNIFEGFEMLFDFFNVARLFLSVDLVLQR